MSPHSNNFYSSFILYINILSELTAVTDSSKPVITPQSYSKDLQVIEAGDGVVLEDELRGGTFAVTSQTEKDDQGNTTTTNWTISSDGKLVKQE